jgi:hypothetical protein
LRYLKFYPFVPFRFLKKFTERSLTLKWRFPFFCVRQNWRIKFNQQNYDYVFNDDESKEKLKKSTTGPSLLKLIDAWLERTPGLVTFDSENGNKVEENFLLKEYEKSVRAFLHDTYVKPAEVILFF